MTAEVAVLNRIGVALASDSAVTIGSQATKIYTSADKLFQLANNAPMGAMVYGNATLSDVPWETIIKTYRKKLGNRTFDTVADYATDVLAFLTNNIHVFPAELQKRHIKNLLSSFFYDLQQALKRHFADEAKKRGGLTDEDLPSLIDDVIEKRQKKILAARRIDHFDDDAKEKLTSEYSEEITALRGKYLGNLPLSEKAAAQLVEMTIELLLRDFFGPYKCGLVIAGFGEIQYAPALVAFELEGMVSGHVRYRQVERYEIDEESDGCILPFAQIDSVMHFLEGIDVNTERFLHKSTGEVVNGAIDLVLKKVGESQPELASRLGAEIRPEIGKLLEKLFDVWSTQKERNWTPIVNMVSALPKDELGAMCEALVNLTKFRRRIAPEKETVGGPIDVAVITKGDGFIWLKRKHYFDPTLNPRVMAKYGREDT